MAHSPIPTWYFALTVVRRENQFVLVHERKHGQLWYLPAGRAELGEKLLDAARRETLEEAGIRVEIDGLVRIEHTPYLDCSRVRIILTAHPLEDKPLKTQPDKHSLEARWVTLEEVKWFSTRGEEVFELFEYLANGGAVYPLSLITFEGAPFV